MMSLYQIPNKSYCLWLDTDQLQLSQQLIYYNNLILIQPFIMTMKMLLYKLLFIILLILPTCAQNENVCAVGTYYNKTTQNCQLCTEYCLACSSSLVCEDCIASTYFDVTQKLCLSCPIFCIECDSTHCDACITGYYNASNNTCVACIADCISCNETTCLSCVRGAFYINGSCSGTCSDNCILCADNGTCDQCQLEYYFNFNQSMCLPCPTNCMYCLDAITCTECYLLYGLMNGTCQLCTPGCQTCAFGNITGCFTCIDEFYLTINKTCKECQDYCVECTEQGCIMSNIGYGINQSGQIVACPSNCRFCSNNICVECKDGYLIANDLCTPCSSGCRLCSSPQACVNCDNGLFINSNATCSKCQFGCYTCKFNSTFCLSCLPGYVWIYQNHTCVACQQNCAMCNKTSSCLVCLQGYEVTSNGSDNVCTSKCSSIVPNCNQCNYLPLNYTFLQNQFNCYSCVEGYELNNNNCVKSKTKKNWLAIVFIVLFSLFFTATILLGVFLFRQKRKSSPKTRYIRQESTVQMITP